ncbi:MAG: 50S ribosomal protein L11 methyltransferase [Flavobacteriaceae bacterium]|nr:50S ribosomal protein L11 methyltransferase [Flavobacteriaceae bacterium]
MSTVYVEYQVKVVPLEPGREILIAEMGAVNFESFVETSDGFAAYIPKEDWYPDIMKGVQLLQQPNFDVHIHIEEIAQENWNKTWESNFDPLVVDGLCSIRAPFHQKPKGVGYDIVIEPKMSFGTGHHETTHMMVQLLLETSLESKSVLDMGCGTAILAILAKMKGATAVDAIDIDNWCYLNSLENIERNNCKEINVIEGDVTKIENKQYDLIIANINRNILIQDIPAYAKALNSGGILFVSGFYKEDLDLLIDRCKQFALEFVTNIEKNKWVAAKFRNMQ